MYSYDDGPYLMYGLDTGVAAGGAKNEKNVIIISYGVLNDSTCDGGEC